MRKILYVFAILHFALSFQSLFGQVEICWNRIDDDGDGMVDCKDSECQDYDFCFECDERFYQVINNRYLATLDIANQWYKDIFVLRGINQINGTAMNPQDGHVYASAMSNGEHILVLVGNNGSLGSLGLVLPGNNVFFMATIDDAGIMYLGNTQSNILSVDLNQTNLAWEDTGIPYPGGTDIAYHYEDGHLYGVGNDGKLIKINPDTGDVVYSALFGPINNDAGYYGAVWANLGGELFAANGTSGKIYHIDISTNIATEVMNATANLNSNDGFNCGLARAPFEVDCGNGIDDDGDGLIDCADPDCANSNSCIVEICNNGIDDDGDGFIDCADAECQAITVCVEICDNGIDDDGNGYIDDADPQCNTSGGNTGGLESNRRLGNKIATRNFVRKKKDIGAKHFPVFHARPIDPNQHAGFDMGMFIPTNAFAEAITMNTSPEDLVDITNATEVLSTDYVIGDRRIASILLLKTENDTYEHSKYICDRLDGAQIKDISTMFFNDAQLITTEIMQADGSIEYVCSFAAYLDNKGAHIENHWLKEHYSQKEEMFNFQIWANDIASLSKIVDATIQRINMHSAIASIETTKPPRVFVSHGKIENGKLNLHLINKNQSESLILEGRQTITEVSGTEIAYQTYTLNKSIRDVISLDMSTAYDVGFRLSTEFGAMDDLFFADGPWGTDFDEASNHLVDYSITASESIEDNEAYSLNRDVSISAQINTSMNVFRGLGPKFRPVDMNRYNNFTFTANGNTAVTIVLVKESVVLWEDQPRKSVKLDSESKKFTFTKSDFGGDKELDWKDIKMVVFEVQNSEGNTKEVSMELRNLNFNNSEIPLVTVDAENGKIDVRPNPFIETTDYHMESEVSTSYKMSLTDNTGRIIKQEEGSLIEGTNSFVLEKTDGMIPGIYFLQIIGGDGNIYTTKIMLSAP